MKKAAVIPSRGLGDALLFMIACHHLTRLGYEVTCFHQKFFSFRGWFPKFSFAKLLNEKELLKFDFVLIENDNSPFIQRLLSLRDEGLNLSIFYPSYKASKHAPLASLDRVFDQQIPVAKNIAFCLKDLFKAFQGGFSLETGIKIPDGLMHKKHSKRVILHPTSGDAKKNWPLKRYLLLAKRLKERGFEPLLAFSGEERGLFGYLEKQEIPVAFFSSIEAFAKMLYESGFFVGNDSFGGHLASCLEIPTVILARSEKEIALWRPGWLLGEVLLPAKWLFNFKVFRLKKHFWGYTIPVARVLQKLQAKN